MLTKGKAIVLSTLKYKDNDLIVKCYTSHRGCVSYLQRGVLKSKKGRIRAVYFQPLSQLEIDETYRPNRSLQVLKEIKPLYLYHTLHTNLIKAAVAMFLAEVLSSTLNEEESNLPLFNFLETVFQYLDKEEKFANFHLLFMLKLSRYLGFYPDLESIQNPYFNLESGLFERESPVKYFIKGSNLEVLKSLLGMDFDALNSLKLSSSQRREFLNVLLLYFELHLGSFRKPKSLQVFNEIFH